MFHQSCPFTIICSRLKVLYSENNHCKSKSSSKVTDLIGRYMHKKTTRSFSFFSKYFPHKNNKNAINWSCVGINSNSRIMVGVWLKLRRPHKTLNLRPWKLHLQCDSSHAIWAEWHNTLDEYGSAESHLHDVRTCLPVVTCSSQWKKQSLIPVQGCVAHNNCLHTQYVCFCTLFMRVFIEGSSIEISGL